MVGVYHIQLLTDMSTMLSFPAIGSTGEAFSMTVAERKVAAEAWVKAGKGK